MTMHRVYPRARGVCFHEVLGHQFREGLSPRLRGLPPGSSGPWVGAGFIPASAGSAHHRRHTDRWSVVYPRACGVGVPRRRQGAAPGGLSPRLRGLRRHPGPGRDAGRFIPAPAGSASMGGVAFMSISVYPRACGSALSFHGQPVDLLVYPRACGVSVGLVVVFVVKVGLSPRLRGLPGWWRCPARRRRFIPAPAGSAGSGFCPVRADPVYPRACGVCRAGISQICPCSGLSPRQRGLWAFSPPSRL